MLPFGRNCRHSEMRQQSVLGFSYCHQSLSSSVGTAEPHGSGYSLDRPARRRKDGYRSAASSVVQTHCRTSGDGPHPHSLELEDVRQAEIARITGLSEGNVRVRIHRIKALLTKKIRAYEE